MGSLFEFLNVCPAYTPDPTTVASGEGVYTSEEWGATRRTSEAYMSDPTSDAAYRRSIYWHYQKLCSAVEFTDRTDLSGFKKLGDIGGAPFVQALVILDRNPSMTAWLTDYDTASIAALRQTPIFAEYELGVFDAREGDLSRFDDCDLITMWGVDYALSDQELGRIVAYCARKGKKLVIGAVRVSRRVAIRTRLRQSALGRSFYQFVRRRAPRPVRLHGVLRSDAYLRNLIALHGGRVSQAHRVGDYNILLSGDTQTPTGFFLPSAQYQPSS